MHNFWRLSSRLGAPHACKHLPWMQATRIPQNLKDVALPMQAHRAIGCFSRAGEVHKTLLGGSRRELEASWAAIWAV